MTSYWQRRVSRRRAVVSGIGLSAGAAALLAGCGGASDSKEAVAPSRVTPPRDTSSQAKRGGVFLQRVEGDELTLDALASSRGGGSGGPAEPGYSRMLREKQTAGTPTSQ